MKQDYDIIPVPISIRRRDGRYTYVNKAWSEMFSEGMEKVVGHTDKDLSLDPLALPQGESDSTTGEYSFRDIYVTTRDKGRLLLELIEIRVGAGTEDEGVMCVHQDMTGIGWRMEDLSRSFERSAYKLRECSHNIARFTAEISEPVEQINQYCEKLGGSVLNTDQRGWLSVVRDNARILQRNVQCRFDVSSLSESAEDAPLALINVGELVNEVCALYEGLAKDKSVNLNVHIGDGLDKPVTVHRSSIRQILVNMVDYAIRGSKGGRIDISATVLAGTDKPLCLKAIIEKPVNSNGAGMGISQKIIRGLCGVIGGRFEICAEEDGSKIMRIYLRILKTPTENNSKRIER